MQTYRLRSGRFYLSDNFLDSKIFVRISFVACGYISAFLYIYMGQIIFKLQHINWGLDYKNNRNRLIALVFLGCRFSLHDAYIKMIIIYKIKI